MSIFGILANRAHGYEDAFGATDCTSDEMKTAINEWFRIFYQVLPSKEEDPCQRIPYTVVNKLTKTVFSEYKATGADDFATSIIDALNKINRRAMHDALIGGVAYLKPFPIGNERFIFSSVARGNVLVFGKDVEGNATDVGTAERTISGKSYYTLLERRTIGANGLLTIRNKLYKSESAEVIGRQVPLSSIPRYEALYDEYTYTEPVGLGMVPLKSPVPNCVDGGTDPVSVYAAAVGLIHNINRNEAELNGEFERGKSRIVVGADLMTTGPDGKRKQLKDDVFVALDENPEDIGINIFSPALREASFLARKTEYLRNVESVIGLKRGLLSEVEAAERTAKEITSTEGDYNLTIIDFQKMWEDAAKECAKLCGVLGRLYQVNGAHDLDENSVTIDWGNGVLYDEDKTWTDYKAMVAAGMLRPEIAVGWYFGMPTETPQDLEAVRERYMPAIDSLMQGGGGF